MGCLVSAWLGSSPTRLSSGQQMKSQCSFNEEPLIGRGWEASNGGI